MKTKILILSTILLGITVSCSPSNILFDVKDNYINFTNTQTTSLTVDDFASYLSLQKEHYPYSDQLIERYQQNSGGYLDTAKKYGVPVDKTIHSPNQKWHFFTSWLRASLDDGSITYNADAKKRIYSNLLCPELLLWIFEACDISPAKAKTTMNVVEEGKSSGTATSSIAKNIKNVVAWEDITGAVTTYISHPENFPLNQVNITGEGKYTITGLSTQGYKKGDKVSFSVTNIEEGKTIDTISCKGLSITNVGGNNFEFIMPYESVNVELTFKNISGVSTVSLGNHNHVTVKVDGETFTDSKQVTNGTNFEFTCEVEQGYTLKKVLINNIEITPTENVYSFQVLENSFIEIKASSTEAKYLPAKYDVVYDLGTKKTAALLETNQEVFNTLVLNEEKESALSSVDGTTYIYGGGNGGSGENRWYAGNMLKFGTTSVNGELIFNLEEEANQVKITGYIYLATGKIRVGDSTSSDWGEDNPDNKTTLYTCSDMTVVSKEAVEGQKANTITIDFASTKKIKIATTNKKPIFITAIEFLNSED